MGFAGVASWDFFAGSGGLVCGTITQSLHAYYCLQTLLQVLTTMHIADAFMNIYSAFSWHSLCEFCWENLGLRAWPEHRSLQALKDPEASGNYCATLSFPRPPKGSRK